MSYSYSDFNSLEGPHLRLKKLLVDDVSDFAESLISTNTWVVNARGVDTKDKLRAYLQRFIEQDKSGESLTLGVRLKNSGEAVAISRFHSAPAAWNRVEIGFTWVADRWTRTFVNTEKKYLMMDYAFGVIGVRRVEFSVDPSNEKSNTAMKRLGATMEGTLRKWRFLNEKDQGSRNIYSIIDDEWPGVKAKLWASIERK